MPTPHGLAGVSLRQLINSRERMLYAAMVVVSLLVYGGLVFAGLSNPEVGASIVMYALLFSFIAFFAQGLALGRIRGNAVKVSERQFPQLHRLAAAHAQRLGLAGAGCVRHGGRRAAQCLCHPVRRPRLRHRLL